MLTLQDSKSINDFFSAISPWEVAYEHSGFSYFAVKQEGVFVLSQARLFLRSAPPIIKATHFCSENIRAGHYPLSELASSARKLLEDILKGNLTTPHGPLQFPSAHNGHYSAAFMPFHREGLQNGTRLDVLLVTGAKRILEPHQPQYDWEVKAASTPYDGTRELLLEYYLGEYRGDFANVEVVSMNVCEVNLGTKIQGNKATIGMILAKNLSPNQSRLGYRVLHQGRVIKRSSIDGSALNWETRDHFQHGSSTIEVPEGALIHCTAIFAGHAQHQGWIADPSTVQNPYRAVYETFDKRMVILQDFLGNSQGRGRDARDLEAGIAWLLWMLGFSVAHLGGTAKTQDAPDLIATSPQGNFVVIECTTGLLKADNKLPRLIERFEALRQGLDASGNRHLRVMPVIISSKSRDEVKADLEQAEKLGVLVLTKESLSEAINRTLVPQNAEIIYEEGERVIREQQRKHLKPQSPDGPT